MKVVLIISCFMLFCSIKSKIECFGKCTGDGQNCFNTQYTSNSCQFFPDECTYKENNKIKNGKCTSHKKCDGKTAEPNKCLLKGEDCDFQYDGKKCPLGSTKKSNKRSIKRLI